MANIGAAALGTKPGVIKGENPAGPQPTLVLTTYKQPQKTRLKIKPALVSVCLGLPASMGFIVHIPKIVFPNSPCSSVQKFLVDHQHFGGVKEAPHATCDRSTHRDGCYRWHHEQQQSGKATATRVAANNWCSPPRIFNGHKIEAWKVQ